MNMRHFILYIGSDNETGKVNRHTIKKILTRLHPGFTLHATGDGYWKENEKWLHEKAVVAEVTTTQIEETIDILKKELKQKSIGVRETSPILFM
jgi:hypothetical protein